MKNFCEHDLHSHLMGFSVQDQGFLFPGAEPPGTALDYVQIDGKRIARYLNEFWTSRQRQASSIHEVSYRACFKAQLPRFFISLLTAPGDWVYDPFSGRGTTAIEAGLLGRRVIANDVNPLSELLSAPRLSVPPCAEIEERLTRIPVGSDARADTDLSMFFHPRTEGEIVALREYLGERKAAGLEDDVDRWIRMVATNRLTGHSRGFFSVYTLPPNQAVSAAKQTEINRRLNQKPEYRDTRKIMMRKTRQLLKRLSEREMIHLREAKRTALFLTRDARETGEIPSGCVQLTVTSPPFLDVVQYAKDNWLRCWFNGIDPGRVDASITTTSRIGEWGRVMGAVFGELYRITRNNGWVAFEVGEVRKGSIKLDEQVIPLGLAEGWACEGIVVNSQRFTKTSNIWGVKNNERGTNSNRIVVFRKDG
jgi:hypothetical protein